MAAMAVLRALRTLPPRTLASASTSSRFPAQVESVPPSASCVLNPPWRTSAARWVQRCSALCAGHNKWSKVKHIKGPKDAARARIFSRFGMMIKMAVKEGGPNPDMNLNLAHILEQCRSKNMPKSSIETAIKNAFKPTSQQMFEARGPGGCALLIEVLTDNTTRSHQEIKYLLMRNGGMLSDSARHHFIRKGVVVVPGQDMSKEQAMELAIEVGAEDVQETEDEEDQPILQFICDMTDLKRVKTSLEDLEIKITSAGLEFLPCTFMSLNQDQLESAVTLIEILNDYPDVFRVWDNIQVDS